MKFSHWLKGFFLVQSSRIFFSQKARQQNSLFFKSLFHFFFLHIPIMYSNSSHTSSSSVTTATSSLTYMNNVMSRFGHHLSPHQRTQITNTMIPQLQNASSNIRDYSYTNQKTRKSLYPSRNDEQKATTD